MRVRAYIYIYNFGRARAFTCTHMYVMLGKPCCVYVTCIFIYICMSMCVYVCVSVGSDDAGARARLYGGYITRCTRLK